MHGKRPIDSPFACSLWLTPQATANSLARIVVEHDSGDTPEARCESAGLEVLRQNNPAARVLPLLELIATCTGGSISLPTSSGQTVRITLDAETQ